MAKILSGILFAVMLLPAAYCAEWFPLPLGKDADQYYYDRSKLVISGDEITYWKKVLFKIPQKFKGGKAKSALYRERIHCKEHTQRTLNYTLYAENGAVLENIATPDAAAEPVQPETVGDQFEKHMCQLLTAKRGAGDTAMEETPKPEPKPDPKIQAQREELEKLRGEMQRLQAAIRKLEQELGSDAPPGGYAAQPGEI